MGHKPLGMGSDLQTIGDGMRLRKSILLCSQDESAEELRLILETRLHVSVTIAYGLGIVSAARVKKFDCAVLPHGDIETIDFLRAREIPTLEIGKGPSYADRAVSGSMMEVLETVRLMCARKRGPKARAA